MDNGRIYRAKMFIDAITKAICGRAGVRFTVGREANAQYTKPSTRCAP
jgi:hypothetical protein